MIVSVVIPFLEDELDANLNTLKHSIGVLLSELKSVKIYFIFIPQPSRNGGDFCSADLINEVGSELGVAPSCVVLEPQKIRSISMARNNGILRSIQLKCSHVYFHDISISVTSSFASAFLLMRGVSDITFSGSPKFVASSEIQLNNFSIEGAGKTLTLSKVTAYPAFNPYVWTYFFPISLISDVRFDERLGPGDLTDLKAGEDYLFLSSVLSKSGFKTFSSSPRAFVFHPSRMLFDKKYLMYAKGQGYACKTVLLKFKRPADLLYAVLFVGNSFVKVFQLKSNSLKILVERFKGLFARLD